MTSKIEDMWSVGKKYLSQADVVMDIGCGVRPHSIWRPNFTIYVEPHQTYIDVLKNKVPASGCLILKKTWAEALDFFPEASVDSACLIDIIEHVQKDEALALLERTKKLVRYQIVIFTPLGFLEQHGGEVDAWGLDGGHLQDHLSAWDPSDLKGFKCMVSPDFHGPGQGAILGIWSKWAQNSG